MSYTVEQYEKLWQPVRLAKVDGTKCWLRFRDALGMYESPGPFFLHDDGFWYNIDPPTRCAKQPVAFRPRAHDEEIKP